MSVCDSRAIRPRLVRFDALVKKSTDFGHKLDIELYFANSGLQLLNGDTLKIIG